MASSVQVLWEIGAIFLGSIIVLTTNDNFGVVPLLHSVRDIIKTSKPDKMLTLLINWHPVFFNFYQYMHMSSPLHNLCTCYLHYHWYRLLNPHLSVLSSSSSLAHSPCNLASATFQLIAHTDLSSAVFLHVWTPFDHSHYSLTTLILVFPVFFFNLVSPEILS